MVYYQYLSYHFLILLRNEKKTMLFSNFLISLFEESLSTSFLPLLDSS